MNNSTNRQPTPGRVNKGVGPQIKEGATRWTVSYNQAGQPRGYADSVYDFDVHCERVDYGDKTLTFKPLDLTYEIFEKVAKSLGTSFTTSEKREWHQTFLKSKRKVAPGIWNFVAITPFND